ncbi:MexH family multidrug efflux RND transporter periplasmic adaptor subunit [Bacteroidia bacterium]|nr:MexH family multidrug efflux RND transporter periplasmic adaptor subunit [Bacteroidia bacterium]GHU79494.1 MexH family multidrug efflux RND transporter periplasmic adaptor subunit [Bacteroidia bacterium]
MNKITKIVLFVIIALFIAGMAFYPTIKRKFKKEEATQPTARSGLFGSNAKPLNINVKIIQPESLTDYIQVTGNLIPDEEVDLTFEATGKIVTLFFQEGSTVSKGQLLAKVNDKPLLAELQKLEAQIPLAEDRVYRQKALLEKDAVSKETYEQVTTELEKLHADIDLVKSRIMQTELRAPFDGIIGLRQVSEGAYASPATVVASLTKIVPLKIEFSVPERYMNMIHPGIPIEFQMDKDIYNASVYAVDSRIDKDILQLKARAVYPNTNGRLKPGRSVSVKIKSNELENAIVVPNEAVIAEMGRDIAYIYSSGRANVVELTKGIRTESNVQVLNGIKLGDTLIVSGIMQLRDGLPVMIDNIN